MCGTWSYNIFFFEKFAVVQGTLNSIQGHRGKSSSKPHLKTLPGPPVVYTLQYPDNKCDVRSGFDMISVESAENTFCFRENGRYFAAAAVLSETKKNDAFVELVECETIFCALFFSAFSPS